MLDMMSQAKNAIEAYNTALKASSSNIANMNVTGYKRLDVSFQSIFEKVLSQGTAAYNGVGGTNPKQFGQGMALSNVSVDFSAGERINGGPLDLAVNGNGLFILSPDGGNSFLYSRAGNFKIDNAGNLTSNGMQVYGLNNSGSLIPISGLDGVSSEYSWDSNGNLLYGGLPWGYQIALTYFLNPGGLAQAQGTTFAETAASGIPAIPQAPGSDTVGLVENRKLEQSNVFYLGETLDALEIQRAMSGNLTVIRMASDMISQFINRLS